MLLTKTVKTKWNPSNKKWYGNKGYVYTKMKDEFEVKVGDLMDNSNVKVDIKCDNCGKIDKNIEWCYYLKNFNNENKCLCHECLKLCSFERARKTILLKRGSSFENWCKINNREDYLLLWDELSNKCKPSEICCSTTKKHYFKCPQGIHESELRQISSITTEGIREIKCSKCNSFAQWGIDNIGEDFLEKYWDYGKNTISPWKVSYSSHKRVLIKCQEKEYHESYKLSCNEFTSGNRCPYCNSFASGGKVHPLDSLGKLLEDRGLLHLWSDKNDKSAYEYSPFSTRQVWWKCPDKKHEDYYRKINNSNTCNFRCPECQYSRGEEKINEYLIKNNIKYIPQKTFNGLLGLNNGNLSYDFYLPVYNLLIEFQGIQHEKYTRGIHKSIKNFEKQLEHDKRKKEYAKKYNIKLLEIWYYDFDNIEEIITAELKQNKNNKLRHCN